MFRFSLSLSLALHSFSGSHSALSLFLSLSVSRASSSCPDRASGPRSAISRLDLAAIAAFPTGLMSPCQLEELAPFPSKCLDSTWSSFFPFFETIPWTWANLNLGESKFTFSQSEVSGPDVWLHGIDDWLAWFQRFNWWSYIKILFEVWTLKNYNIRAFSRCQYSYCNAKEFVYLSQRKAVVINYTN